jgi:hypothetical protein
MATDIRDSGLLEAELPPSDDPVWAYLDNMRQVTRGDVEEALAHGRNEPLRMAIFEWSDARHRCDQGGANPYTLMPQVRGQLFDALEEAHL